VCSRLPGQLSTQLCPGRIFDHLHDPRSGLQLIECPLCRIVDVNPGRRWRRGRVVCAVTVELPVAEDGPSVLENASLHLLDCAPPVTRQLPGDALSEEALGTALAGTIEEVGCTLPADAVVGGGEFGELGHIIRQICELTDHHIRLKVCNRADDQLSIENISHYRFSTQILE